MKGTWVMVRVPYRLMVGLRGAALALDTVLRVYLNVLNLAIMDLFTAIWLDLRIPI